MRNIQAIDVPFQVSEDNGVTWKTVVCMADHSADVSSDTTETNTACGVAVGVGPVKFNPSFNAVHNTQLDPGTISYKEVLAYAIARTNLKYRVQDPQTSGSAGSVGSNLYLSGYGFFTQASYTATVGDVIKFSGQFKGVGIPSATPGT